MGFDAFAGQDAFVDKCQHLVVQCLDFSFQHIHFFGIAIKAEGFTYSRSHERLVGGIVLFVELVDRTDDCFLQLVLHNGGRVFTVFFSVVQTADASPHNTLDTVSRPCHSPVAGTAVAADKDIGQRVAGILSGGCDRTLCGAWGFGLSPGQFLLHLIEGQTVNDGRVIVLYIVHGSFASVLLSLLFDAVYCHRFLQDTSTLELEELWDLIRL